MSSLSGDGALVIKVVIRGSSALEGTGVTGLISLVCPVFDVGLRRELERDCSGWRALEVVQY